MNAAPHNPVLINESIKLLLTNLNGTYLDGTVGFGGHAEAILNNLLKDGCLIGTDLDPYALEYSKKRLSSIQKSYSLHNCNYREYPNLLQSLGIKKLTGIFIDLGSSSCQIDTKHRGFSYQKNATLDMRFNQSEGVTAQEYLNTSNEEDIAAIIKQYGEEKYYKNIAKNIINAANANKMNTTFDLKLAVSKCVHPRHLTKSLSRVFQAIRIKINNEIESLKDALLNSLDFLEKGGRIAIISFHSIEDKIVKHFFKNKSLTCICPPKYPICQCNTEPTLKILTKKAIIPLKTEREDNSRSRSAKLRVAERI